MITSEMFCSPLAERIVLTLAHFLWQGSLVAALVLVAGVVVGSDVRRRYLASTLGFVLLVLFPLVTFFVLNSSPIEVGQNENASEVMTFETPAAVDGRTEGFAATAGIPIADDALKSLSPWLLTAWLVGVATFSTRLLLGMFSIAWLKRTGEVAGEALGGRVRDLCKKIKLRAPVVRVSRRVTQAMAVGFWRPVIILPAAWLIQLPPECLEAVLAHELAHIRRRDLWVNLLQRVVETFLFYHPAVWWLSARLRHEREMCCDELAVSLTGRRVEYASTLELVARRRRAHIAPALAAGIGGKKMALLNRVRNILGLSPATGGVGPWTCGALAVLAAGAVCWIVSGGSPLKALAGDDSLVALADDEQGERADGQREGDRDGDRERGEREGPRDGDREEPRREGPRDGDRPRPEGEVRRDGDRPRPPGAEDFHRRIEEMQRKVQALVEQGRREEAEALQREIRTAVARFEQRARDGDRPRPEVPPEVRERLEQLHRQLGEAKEAGRADEAERLERELRSIQERLAARREGEPRREGEGDRDRPRGDGPRPEFGPVNPELLQVIRELREEVGRLRREVDALKGGPGPREGDRPRVERDGPRPDARTDQPRREAEGDRPRPDRPRDGDERDATDRRQERERDPPPRREGGDREGTVG